MKNLRSLRFDARFQELIALFLVGILTAPFLFLRVGAFGSDMVGYLQRGISLLHGSWGILAKRPVYSILFALAYAFGGVSPASALWVTKGALVGSLILLYAILRHLYDIKTGLIVLVLAVLSPYLMGFPSHFAIDQTMAFFMLLSLYLLLLAFDKSHSKFWALASGIALAMGVLTKEVAIIWLPLPFYFWGGVRPWRQRRHAKTVFAFIFGFFFALAGWMIILYLATGEWNVLVQYSGPVGNAIQAIQQWGYKTWGLLFFSFIVLVILGIFRKQGLSSIRIPSASIDIGVLLLGIGVTFFLSNNLALRWYRPLGDLLDIWNRIVAFWEYGRSPESGLVYLAGLPWALLIVLIEGVWRRGRMWVLPWLVLSVLPITMADLAFKPRYGVILYWVAYMVLARGLTAVIDGVTSILPLPLRWKQGVVAMLILGFVGWGAIQSWKFPFSYPYHRSPYYHYIDENAPAIQAASQWIQKHIAHHEKIATLTSLFHGSLALLGYDTYNLYSVSGDALDRGEALALDPNGHWRFTPTPFPSKPLLFQRGTGLWERYYGALMENSLIDALQEKNIDDLIVVETPYHYGALHLMPGYFRDHPAFRLIYTTRWKDNRKDFALHIFHVDRTRLDRSDYPTVVTARIWPVLLKDAKKKAGKDVDRYVLIQDLFQGGPIFFRPKSPENWPFYHDLAQAYATHQDWNRAALEYHFALDELETVPAPVVSAAETWTQLYPHEAGPWLLLGDVRMRQGDVPAAREAYEKALASPNTDPLIVSAAHAALGRADYTQQHYAQAVEHFDQALASHVFGAHRIRVDRLLALAAFHQSQGDAKQAIRAYQEAIELDPTRMLETYQDMMAFGQASRTELLAEAFDKVLTAQEEKNTLRHPDLFPVLVRFYQQADRLEGVARAYEVMLAQDEDIADAWMALGQVYEHLGENEKARMAYQKAMDLEDTPDAQLYIRLMSLYASQGAIEQAFDVYRQGIRAFPDDPSLHLALAKIYLSMAHAEKPSSPSP